MDPSINNTARLTLALLLVSLVVASSCVDEGSARVSLESRSGFTCELVRMVTEFADGSHDEHWSCLDGPEAINLDPAFEQEHWDSLMSGRAQLGIDLLPASTRSDLDDVIEASDIEILNEEDLMSARGSARASAIGEGTVLALRVMATDSDFPVDEAALAVSIFGGQDDQVNLHSQFRDCSHGKRTIVPAQGPSIHGGVMTVSVDMTAAGHSGAELRQAAVAKAQEQLGLDLGASFDHVMACIPPGTDGGWVANAAMNHHQSTYNGLWCTRPSAQTHEIGHNSGLGHSGLGEDKYGDATGNMSYAHNDGEGPKRCFNAARSSHLGWYADKEISIDPGSSATYTLIGAIDYPAASGDQVVLLKVDHPDSEVEHTIHIAYNVAKGANAGTGAAVDMVAVVEQSESKGAPSARRAALKEGDAPFSFDPFGAGLGTLTLEVLEQGQAEGVDFARVEVTFGGGGSGGDGGGGSGGDGGAGDENSCVGYCGGQAPGGCWCDDACAEHGDCCSDFGGAC